MLQQQGCDDDDEDEDGYPNPRYKQAGSTTDMTKRASSMNILRGTKRPNGWNQDGNGHAKKIKTDISLAPKLGTFRTFSIHQQLKQIHHPNLTVTKEYTSVTSLRKPFKTPFKTPLEVPLQEVPQTRLPEREVHEDVEEPNLDLGSKTFDDTCSSPPMQSCRCFCDQLLRSGIVG